MNTNTKQISGPYLLDLARDVLAIEADAIRLVSDRLDDAFVAAVQLVLQAPGRLVVTGMGKSGHIARKLAATLASTGTPAFFVHPGEAAHGDLGMITPQDVVLALSNSGESDEVVALLPSLKRKAIPLIAMTGNPASSLGRAATVHLNSRVDKEACPLNLAPTASTTAALALGDALAVALLDAREFSPEDFAMSHPGGSLGRRLLVHVRDVMHAGERLPVVQEEALLRDALLEVSGKGLGMTAIVDAAGALVGIFTDGDLRRAFDRDIDLKTAKVSALMSRAPRTIEADALAAEAVQKMQSWKVNGLLVTENGQLVGALNMHDMLRAGVV